MRYFVGLDVGLHQTAICVIDANGVTVSETSVETEPKLIALALRSVKRSCVRIGLESCSLAEWLCPALVERGLPAICIEARHAHGVLKANINKTDRNDAKGIAHLMRVGLYHVVHIKGIESQKLRTLITARRLIQIKAIDIENAIGGFLRGFGLKVGRVTQSQYEMHIQRLMKQRPELVALIEPLLKVRATLREQFDALDNELTTVSRADPICRRLMTAPGVGPIAAATYRAVIDNPSRFKRSRTVGAHLGLTPRTRQSGATDTRGRISRCGDSTLRAALYNAGFSVLHPRTGESPLRTWGLTIMSRRGRQKAIIAVARRLATILHRMWCDGRDYELVVTAA